jgi:hydrogenase-4 component F
VGQTDYKRLLAYSSVEHMGILALGIGLGGAAAFGAMLHTVSHSLAKAMLFLVAGNILAVYHTKAAGQVSGALRVLPVSGALWIGGLFAITGTPPSGLFPSEFTILTAAAAQGHIVVAGLFLLLLSVIFIGMITPALRMAQGPPPSRLRRAPSREAWAAVAAPLVLGAAVVALGFIIPPPLSALLHSAARALGAP